MTAEATRAWPGLEDDPNPFVPAPRGPRGAPGPQGEPGASGSGGGADGTFSLAVTHVGADMTLPAKSQIALIEAAGVAATLPLAADAPGALVWVYPVSGDSYTIHRNGDDAIVQLGAGEVGPVWNLTGYLGLMVSDGVATWHAKAM